MKERIGILNFENQDLQLEGMFWRPAKAPGYPLQVLAATPAAGFPLLSLAGKRKSLLYNQLTGHNFLEILFIFSISIFDFMNIFRTFATQIYFFKHLICFVQCLSKKQIQERKKGSN
ncbi:hypothetical protein EGI22_23280 [Lacihabitans sp. LS3-19]|uniref:hypothetical protein n=1 Tax=Lacihabitans sp. LS3-19 TaxID=2487335 RepID=UPI0020CFA50A|nr:hypothetical protein [Lacihabitans sp. LS3-19]MCP9770837.1 hypothetical protein [Lacihabitans sp. LS3-19]